MRYAFSIRKGTDKPSVNTAIISSTGYMLRFVSITQLAVNHAMSFAAEQ